MMSGKKGGDSTFQSLCAATGAPAQPSHQGQAGLMMTLRTIWKWTGSEGRAFLQKMLTGKGDRLRLDQRSSPRLGLQEEEEEERLLPVLVQELQDHEEVMGEGPADPGGDQPVDPDEVDPEDQPVDQEEDQQVDPGG